METEIIIWQHYEQLQTATGIKLLETSKSGISLFGATLSEHLEQASLE